MLAVHGLLFTLLLLVDYFI